MDFSVFFSNNIRDFYNGAIVHTVVDGNDTFLFQCFCYSIPQYIQHYNSKTSLVTYFDPRIYQNTSKTGVILAYLLFSGSNIIRVIKMWFAFYWPTHYSKVTLQSSVESR